MICIILKVRRKTDRQIPFCREGGTAKATGRGEIIEELPQLDGLYFAIAMGGEGLSTAEIYKEFDGDPDISHSTELIEKASKDGKPISGLLYNGLEKAASKKINVKEFKDLFIKRGACDALMSGSGAAIYGLFGNMEDAVKAAEAFNADGIFCVASCAQGKIKITK